MAARIQKRRSRRWPWRTVSDKVRLCGVPADKIGSRRLPIAPHAAYRRNELQAMYGELDAQINCRAVACVCLELSDERTKNLLQ